VAAAGQRRYLCLQIAQKPGGYDEQVLAQVNPAPSRL
jgi:hypothetical protein